jgi:hypothetical protein
LPHISGSKAGESLSSVNNLSQKNNIVKSSTSVKHSIEEDNSLNKGPVQDNKRKILSKEQQEYFTDSKIVDDKGRLIRVYHGTDSEDFNVFDLNKVGSNLYPAYGECFYFAKSKSTSETYTGRNGVYNVKDFI